MADKFKSIITEGFKDTVGEEIGLDSFLENEILEQKGAIIKTAAGKFGKKIRESLISHKVKIDISPKTIQHQGGVSDIEAKYLSMGIKALVKLKKADYGKVITLDSSGNSVLIISGKGRKKAFELQQALFKEGAKEAYKLIGKDYKNFATINASTLGAIKTALIDARENDPKALQDVYKKFTRGDTPIEGEKVQAGDIESIARERIKRISTGHIEVHAGHLEGLENFRYATIGRAAIGAFAIGVTDENDPLIKKYIQEISATVKIDKDVVHSLFSLVAKRGKITGWKESKITQETTLQLKYLNIASEQEQDIGRELGTLVKDKFHEWADTVDARDYAIKAGNSPSIIRIVENYLVQLLTDGKHKTISNIAKRSKRKKSKPIKRVYRSNNKIPVIAPKFKGKRVEFSNKLQKINREKQLDAFALQGLINTMLAEEVEKKMADASSSDGRLRYQTGRFAESANLLTLTRNQAGILAGVYSYQRDPYDVFLPGHKMGTPKRDPRIYVEGAIREAALIALKGKMPGIALELK